MLRKISPLRQLKMKDCRNCVITKWHIQTWIMDGAYKLLFYYLYSNSAKSTYRSEIIGPNFPWCNLIIIGLSFLTLLNLIHDKEIAAGIQPPTDTCGRKERSQIMNKEKSWHFQGTKNHCLATVARAILTALPWLQLNVLPKSLTKGLSVSSITPPLQW